MKYKTLFRMLLKAIGILVFIQGIGMFLSHVGYVTMGMVAFAVVGAVGGALQMLVGLYLFFGGKWIADKAIPGNRPYCHESGYDLTNAAGNLCAECGTPFKPAQVSSAP